MYRDVMYCIVIPWSLLYCCVLNCLMSGVQVGVRCGLVLLEACSNIESFVFCFETQGMEKPGNPSCSVILMWIQHIPRTHSM